MSELTLTEADSITVEAFYDAGAKQDWAEPTEHIEVDRWTKHGHDRLYINAGIPKADKYSLYVDLEAHEIHSDNTSKHSGGDVEIEGDEAVITIEESGGDKVHEITVALKGEGFESADETHECEECGSEHDSEHGLAVHKGLAHGDDEDGESEDVAAEAGDDSQRAVADGGEDVTSHVGDATIEEAIAKNDDPDHPDALTVDEVRDLLATVQRGAEEGWGIYMDHVEDGDAEVVHEDSEVVILSTGEHNSVADELDYHNHIDADGIAKSVVTQVHHSVAKDRCDRTWSADYPYVIRKPDGFGGGQRYVEAVINGLQTRGLTAGQAWAYYGVEIRGKSQSAWARRCSRDQSQIAKALKKARQKIP